MQRAYDYIIGGGGASGLYLASVLADHPIYKDFKGLIIDPKTSYENDRTWCFWEKGLGAWDELIFKQWDTIKFKSDSLNKNVSINPFQYKMIRSKEVYSSLLERIKKHPNIEFCHEKIVHYSDEGVRVLVSTEHHTFSSKKMFSSILNWDLIKSQTKYPLLQQHFVGWFVKTSHPIFDKQKATFMDFSVSQKKNTRFMYVLPFSDSEALIEYTLFSKDLLSLEEYENSIDEYLVQMGAGEYSIAEKEQGSIPMTAFPFEKRNTKNILHIGSAGGWTKPTTGFTFKNIERKTNELSDFLEIRSDFSKFTKSNRFRFYDLLFLDVLHRYNEKGSMLFSKLFQKNSAQRIFRFLDEQSSIKEEVKLMRTMPTGLFILAFIRRLFRIN
ncbi:MAG: lycopene cyclase family protein [Flavobacteriaceae bacterium]|nr:lycopene cyclase family protein [Flavobacteriaceae bacterium]MDG2314585.1 lycopene cyclase family protein [Flavobacteriaceae bacterium]